MNRTASTIGLELKQLAKIKKIAVADIATALNISPQGVYDIFKRKSIGSETLKRICDVMGVNPNDVLGVSQNVGESLIKESDNFNSKARQVELSATIEEQRAEIEYLRKLLAQLAQSNQALIEQLGKSEASGLLAGAYA